MSPAFDLQETVLEIVLGIVLGMNFHPHPSFIWSGLFELVRYQMPMMACVSKCMPSASSDAGGEVVGVL